MQRTTELEKELAKQGTEMQELISQVSKLQGELVDEKNKSSATFHKIHQQVNFTYSKMEFQNEY